MKKHYFDKDIAILNEHESTMYRLKATGFFLRRMFSPDVSIQDSSGMELLVANCEKFFVHRKHVLFQGDSYRGFVKE